MYSPHSFPPSCNTENRTLYKRSVVCCTSPAPARVVCIVIMYQLFFYTIPRRRSPSHFPAYFPIFSATAGSLADVRLKSRVVILSAWYVYRLHRIIIHRIFLFFSQNHRILQYHVVQPECTRHLFNTRFSQQVNDIVQLDRIRSIEQLL